LFNGRVSTWRVNSEIVLLVARIKVDRKQLMMQGGTLQERYSEYGSPGNINDRCAGYAGWGYVTARKRPAIDWRSEIRVPQDLPTSRVQIVK
jgi:hypothetical protein